MSKIEDLLVGYQDGRRVTITMRLEERLNERGELPRTVEHEPITEWLSFAVTTAVWNRSNTDWETGGATIEPLQGIERPKYGDIIELIELHERWHLNDMRAGCAHQTVAVPPAGHRDPTGYRLENTRPCPTTGYRWGSAWLVEPLPEEVIMTVQKWLARGSA